MSVRCGCCCVKNKPFFPLSRSAVPLSVSSLMRWIQTKVKSAVTQDETKRQPKNSINPAPTPVQGSTKRASYNRNLRWPLHRVRSNAPTCSPALLHPATALFDGAESPNPSSQKGLGFSWWLCLELLSEVRFY